MARAKPPSARPAAKRQPRAVPLDKTGRSAAPQGAGDGTVMLAFLRGINVGGNKLIPMAELRVLASGLGFGEVETFIQSGNLIFTTTLPPADVEVALERAIAKKFGFTVDVIARTAAQWHRTAAAVPFADAASERPHLLHLGLAKAAVRAGASEALGPYAKGGERVHAAGDCLWIDYPVGVARSKLSPAVLDRAVGSTVTARNWRTVQKLTELVAARAGADAGAKKGPR